MRKIILITILGILLISCVFAKQVDTLDWKTKKLTIAEDGIYDGKVKILDKERAEIWIDKKIEKIKDNYPSIEYHVDSLVNGDVKAKVKLYYDIQPDTIYYKSHTGKYEGYVTWEWEDEEVGGYATLDVTLEYGLGSNVFVSAISGAIWMNDGVDMTLPITSYSISTNQFTLTDRDYEYRLLNVSYNYQYPYITEAGVGVNSTIQSVKKIPAWLSIIVVLSIVGILLAIVFSLIPKIKLSSGEIAEI